MATLKRFTLVVVGERGLYVRPPSEHRDMKVFRFSENAVMDTSFRLLVEKYHYHLPGGGPPSPPDPLGNPGLPARESQDPNFMPLA